MSQVDQSTELPDQIQFGIRRTEDKQQFRAIQGEIADRRDCDSDDVARVDVLRALMHSYQRDGSDDLDQLREDKRIRETIEAIASDHDCDPSDVSLECAMKTACAAYTGFQQTDDWLSENGEE